MKTFLNALIGGLVIIVAAGIIGVAHNTTRSTPVKLIQHVPAALAASGNPGAETGEDEYSSTAPVSAAISVDQMREVVDEGLIVVLDARSPAEYAEEHIPGAINIPYDELPAYLETLSIEAPVDQGVVAYCRGPKCDLSDHLATELRLMGYVNVRVFKNGMDGWTEAGFPVVTGTEP
jgi:rhodanese-related sulfurtransferase